MYLLCDRADEIGHLVKSYVALSTKGVFPCLPNAPVDLMHPCPSGNEPGGGSAGEEEAAGGGEDSKKASSASSQSNATSSCGGGGGGCGGSKSTTGNNTSSSSSSTATISLFTSTSTASSAPSSPRRQSMWGALFTSVAKDDISSPSTIADLSVSSNGSNTDSSVINYSGVFRSASVSTFINPPNNGSSNSSNSVRRASYIDPAVLAAAIEKEKFEESDEDDNVTGSDAWVGDVDSDDSGAGAGDNESD